MSVAVAPSVGTAAAWRLLSLGFTPPSEDTLAEVAALAEALLELGDGSVPAEALEPVLAASRESRLDDLRAGYQRLFSGVVRITPYEGSYELDPIRQGRELADIAAFYRAFGAEAHGPVAERPDHIGCELEFLSFLELRRLAALEEEGEANVQLLEHILESFLADHAGRWLPTFFAEVAAAVDAEPLHRSLAVLGGIVVRDELERRGLEPATLARRHSPSAVEGDTIDCG